MSCDDAIKPDQTKGESISKEHAELYSVSKHKSRADCFEFLANNTESFNMYFVLRNSTVKVMSRSWPRNMWLMDILMDILFQNGISFQLKLYIVLLIANMIHNQWNHGHFAAYTPIDLSAFLPNVIWH